MLDHQYLEDNQIIDRYVMGKLSETEQEQFAEHFLDCAQCLDQLELAESFQKDLQAAVAQGLTQQVQQGILVRLFRSKIASGVGLLAAAALIMMFILPSSHPDSLRITLESSSRGTDLAQGPVSLQFSKKVPEYTLVKKVILSKQEQETALYKAEIRNAVGGLVYSHESHLSDNEIQLKLESLPTGSYRLSLTLARDGIDFQAYESFDLNVLN